MICLMLTLQPHVFMLRHVEEQKEVEPDALVKHMLGRGWDEVTLRAAIRQLIDAGKLNVSLGWKLVRGDGETLWP